MKNQWQSFLIALQFLTMIPVRLTSPVKDTNQGNSLLYYPFIGLIIGSIILFNIYILDGQSYWVSAILTLTLWIALTGGLHLDGLADSADAWLGGLGDKAKTLLIMKDPASGPIAVVVLLMLLLIKFIMLAELIQQQAWLSIMATIILSRLALPLLLMTTPYVRPNGLGAILVKSLPRQSLRIMLASVAFLALIMIDFIPLLLFLAVLLVLRYCMMQRLGGTTGDTAGAMVEILEVTLLISFVII
ncbi:MAG: adenosylcobinamide-GDP ribazoletransferase [Piscirickettsiaceae bacterium]|nr:adenosylcobinamide-GDP ribazoletransferase [Piscirickettsiaceae bacterium]